jgi:hypothetical protein
MDAVIFWSIFSGYGSPAENNVDSPDRADGGDRHFFPVSGSGGEILFDGVVPGYRAGAAFAFRVDTF